MLYSITADGRITEDVTAQSLDHKVEILIPEGTIAKSRSGSLLYVVFINEETEPPAPPIRAKIISLCYDIGPDNATFDPMIYLTFKYDDTEVPQGVMDENLVIAKYDWATEQWQELESTVDPENNSVTTRLSYFSTYAVLAYTRPASFTVADLSVTPAEVNLGESVSISVLITNTGDLTGSYEVSLKKDNVLAQTKEVTLNGGDSETVSFKVTHDIAGEHKVDISGLLGTFKVKTPEIPPTTTPAPTPVPAMVPAPASFSISDLTITPGEAKPTEQVTISAVVTNTGGTEGGYTVVLKINGAEEATKEVALAAGKSETVTFTIAKDTVGSYTVNISGKVGQFTVIAPPPPLPTPVAALPVQPPTNWGLIGGIVAGCAVAIGLLVYFIWWRKRSIQHDI